MGTNLDDTKAEDSDYLEGWVVMEREPRWGSRCWYYRCASETLWVSLQTTAMP